MNAADRKKRADVLASWGLPQAEDPRIGQALAFFVRDEDHFRRLLVRQEPELRYDMYEAMRPYLRFPVRPLEDYVRQTAEHIAELESHNQAVQVGQHAMDNAFADEQSGGKTLVLTCYKCTQQEGFVGETHVLAVIEARKAGWVYDKERDAEICPKCPAVREATAAPQITPIIP
jgi:hypothetical protein